MQVLFAPARVQEVLQASTPGELRGRLLAVTVALAGAAVPAGLGLGGMLGGLARPALASLIVACGAGIIGLATVFGIRQGARFRSGAAERPR